MGEKEFAERLYVVKEDEAAGPDEFYYAEEDPHNLADPKEPERRVAIYQLVGMGRLVTEVSVEQEDAS